MMGQTLAGTRQPATEDGVARAWRRIEAVLSPEARKALRPGAGAGVLARLEKALGASLPRELRASLAVHDGTRANCPLWSNEHLLAAAEIAARACMMRGMLRAGHLDPEHWRPSWIPLTDADGDGTCYDTARRKVVYFRNHGGGGQVVAATIGRWLAGIPRRIAAESRAERETDALLGGGAGGAGTKRERERERRMDRELPFLVSYVQELARHAGRGSAARAAVLRFRPISRFASSEVLARAAARGFVEVRGARVRATPLGDRLARTAFG